MNEKKCYIMDYSFYIYNGAFAYPDLQNKAGFKTGALYHVSNYLVPKLRENYETILIFDPPKADLDRTQMLADYKGNRPPTPEYIKNQMLLGQELFPLTDKVLCYASETEESDDVMATIAISKARDGYKVVVGSDDKDMFPLLGYKNITLFRQKQYFTKEHFGPYMKKKHNIDFTDPSRFDEFLAIIGDSADNYNVIKGLGPKAAEYFLTKYNHILDLWDDWDNVEEKYRKKLLKSCSGYNCKKCKSCDIKGTDLIKLKDELNLSLQLAQLNTKAKYKLLNVKSDKSAFIDKIYELELRHLMNNAQLFF
jgi:5'-3' exonuclease